MKFTIDWLQEHLDTKYNDKKIIDKLTNIGLEVESFENQSSEQNQFIIAKISRRQFVQPLFRVILKSGCLNITQDFIIYSNINERYFTG